MINLMNYYEHPADNRYYIFEYRSVEKADCFEAYLKKDSIVFEKLVEEETEEKMGIIYYAIAKSYFKEALKANNLTEAKYRKPLISNVILRYLFVLFMAAVIGLALYGYLLDV